MDLTPNEIKYTEKYIQRLEKDSRHWPRTRWLLLIAAIPLIGINLYSLSLLTNLNDLIFNTISIHPKNFNPEAVELFVKGQIVNLRLEMYFLMGIFLQALIVAYLLIYPLINWNCHLKCGIIAKALSKIISEK
jgi:hypothetical protein